MPAKIGSNHFFLRSRGNKIFEIKRFEVGDIDKFLPAEQLLCKGDHVPGRGFYLPHKMSIRSGKEHPDFVAAISEKINFMEDKMITKDLIFYSNCYKLAAVLYLPDNYEEGRALPCIIPNWDLMRFILHYLRER